MFIPLSLMFGFLGVFFILAVMVATEFHQSGKIERVNFDLRRRHQDLHEIALAAVDMFIAADLDASPLRTMSLDELALRRKLREVPAYDLFWNMRQNAATYEARRAAKCTCNKAVLTVQHAEVAR